MQMWEQFIVCKEETTYGSFTFDIKEEREWLAVDIHSDTPRFYVLLWDPNGKLRYHYYLCFTTVNRLMFHTNPELCSYMAVPGAIPAGQWKVEVMGRPIMKEVKIAWREGNGEIPFEVPLPEVERTYWTQTDYSSADSPMKLNVDLDEVVRDEPGWYCGDLHAHTMLSDGEHTPEQLMQQAEEEGLDFLAVTDHNMVQTSWPKGKGKTLIIPGTETSAARGHCNLLFLQEWPDFRLLRNEQGMINEQGMLQLIREAKKRGDYFYVNHAMVDTVSWRFPTLPLDELDAVEIWNYVCHYRWPEPTEHMLTLWSALWNDGRQITGIAGTDTHYLENPKPREAHDPVFPKWDFLVFIHAEKLSANALRKGLERRRVYATRAPYLSGRFQVDGISESLTFGDEIKWTDSAKDHVSVHAALEVTNLTEGSIHWIENGVEVLVQPIQGEGTYDSTFEWQTDGYCWRRAEIRSLDGQLQAFTNPIFHGSKTSVLQTWGDLLELCGMEPK